MTQAINTQAIEKATGTPWQDWLAWLDEIGAADMPHREIVVFVSQRPDVSGWWAQNITVAYEQHIVRSAPGQDNSGRYQVGVSKTLTGTMDDALIRWEASMTGVQSLSGVVIIRGPEHSSTEKWRYWRGDLADGSRVKVHIHQKSPEKSVLGIQHDGLENTDQVEHWRAYWKAQVKPTS